MTYEEYNAIVSANYRPLHKHLYSLREDFFVPALVSAVRDGSPAALRKIYEEPHPQIYIFNMLRPEFCAALLEEVENFASWCDDFRLPLLRPNTMNNYGAILDSFGFSSCLQQMMKEYVAPFASLLYADVGGDSLDSHHGFTVEYEVEKDTSLDFHVDASDVTLNVCLGKQFKGGSLYFRGIRCGLCQQTYPLPHEEFEVAHAPGQAILHRGKHRHGANSIEAGERYNLILWCNSSHFAKTHDETRCHPWCNNPGDK